MKDSTALIWSYLNILTKKRYDALAQKFGNLDDALPHLRPSLLSELGCREETIIRTMVRLEEFDTEHYCHELERLDVHLLSIEDEQYPTALREIGDPPVFLHYIGDIEILSRPSIALVGSREMTDYGKRIVEAFVPRFVSAGLVTVSGLAIGIDEHVARETLAVSGTTVAVLGHGLARIFPTRNSSLAKEIVEKGGLLLSEFPLDSAPDTYTFPARNRIIAGLTHGTVVLQAGEGSGALITSDLALDYGREVFAVPGQIFDPAFSGSHQEIMKGHANLVSSPDHVLEELGIIAPTEPRHVYIPESEEESLIYKALSTMPQTVDEIVEKAKISANILNATLTLLELKEAVKNVGNGQWVRR